MMMPCVNTGGNTPSRSAQPVHRLQGIRFPGRDYRIPAFYMITMTALDRKPLFAACENGTSTLNDDGWIVYDLWHRMAKDYPQIDTSTLVIMPDHLHGLLRVKEQMEKPVGVPLRAFKSQVTSALRKKYGNPDLNVWTPGYHDLAVWRRGALDAYIRYMKDNLTGREGDRAERAGCWRVGHPIEAGRLRPLLQATWSLLRPLCAGQAPDSLLPPPVSYSRNAHAYDVPGHEPLVRGNSIASRPIASCWPLRKRTNEWLQDALYFRLIPPSSVRSIS
jgi:putative transposase